MSAPADLITADQLTTRVGSAVMARVFDDGNNGIADPDVIAQFVSDASSKVRGALGTVYGAAILDASSAIELRRIALDCAQAMMAQRHPGSFKLDGFTMMEQVDRDLKMIRTGLANLGGSAPVERTGSKVVRSQTNTPRGW